MQTTPTRPNSVRTKCTSLFGDSLFDESSPDCLVKSNAFGELRYDETLSCAELGKILYAGINPQIKIAEDDSELFSLMTIAHNTGLRSDKLGVYLMRAVSLILQNKDSSKGYNFHGYRGKIAEDLRDDGIRAAIDCVKYWNPSRAAKGKKPAFTFITYCVLRRMKGTLTRHKKKLLNRIKREEKNGCLANPELYICLGAFTKENFFDGRKISCDGGSRNEETFVRSHEYFNRLKADAIRRIKERYRDGNNLAGNIAADEH